MATEAKIEVLDPVGEVASLRHNRVDRSGASNDDQIVLIWLGNVASQRRSTYKAYMSDMQQFRQFSHFTPFAMLTEGSITAYKLWLLEQYKINTVRRKLRVVRAFLSYAHKSGYLPFEIGAIEKMPKGVPWQPSGYSEAEIMVMLQHAGSYELLIRVLYYGALRVSEALAIHWNHLIFKDAICEIFIPNSKTHKQRTVAIAGNTAALIAALDRSGDDLLFRTRNGKPLDRTNTYKAVQQIRAKAGLDKGGLHKLRHSHATHAIARGASVADVRDTLGHSSIAITNAYIDAARVGNSGKTLIDFYN